MNFDSIFGFYSSVFKNCVVGGWQSGNVCDLPLFVNKRISEKKERGYVSM